MTGTDAAPCAQPIDGPQQPVAAALTWLDGEARGCSASVGRGECRHRRFSLNEGRAGKRWWTSCAFPSVCLPGLPRYQLPRCREGEFGAVTWLPAGADR